jgi:hypothetical protein
MLGYRMALDTWMRWVNGIWIAAVLLMVIVNVPSAAALARLARQAAEAGDQSEAPAGFAATFLRWRIANIIQSVLYLALLALMVFRWRG